jgi:antitoxin component YwqK of YwqJK toxin-antitoxin module
VRCGPGRSPGYTRPVTGDDEPIAHEERYDNGAVKLRGSHLDGEMHGDWVFYRRDGSLMRSGAFDRGRQIGTWRTYDRSGAVVKETVFPERSAG